MVEAVRVGDGGALQGVGKLGRMGRPMVIPNKSGWYGVAGASVVAAAVTARYVAKWRVRRSMRRGKGDRGLGGGRCFIGLDLSDPTAENKRPCDYAVLDSDLVCTFGQWEYREDAARIIPDRALGRSFILAIDGPQGLAGEPGATVRESERLVHAPGRTPYELQESGKPFEGFIKGSVALFYRLVSSGSRFRLLGLDGLPASDATLIEVFPGAAWKVVAEKPLPAKRTIEGRQARVELLSDLRVQLPPREQGSALPSHDQLDAAMAAWVAYRFWLGEARVQGRAPEMDEKAGAIREGYIVQPPVPEEELDESVVPV